MSKEHFGESLEKLDREKATFEPPACDDNKISKAKNVEPQKESVAKDTNVSVSLLNIQHLHTDSNGVAPFEGTPFMTSCGPCTSSIPNAGIK